MGQVFINGEAPVLFMPSSGQPAVLTFGFLDVVTGLPAPGPAVASVHYEVDLTPDLVEDFIPLGVVTNAGSGFRLDWTVPGVEALVQARPFDASGAPIAIPGDNGAGVQNGLAAVVCPIPEPTTWLLLGTGCLGVLARGWGGGRRRRGPARPADVTVPLHDRAGPRAESRA